MIMNMELVWHVTCALENVGAWVEMAPTWEATVIMMNVFFWAFGLWNVGMAFISLAKGVKLGLSFDNFEEALEETEYKERVKARLARVCQPTPVRARIKTSEPEWVRGLFVKRPMLRLELARLSR
jgi:hypothetical protein